jgi:hypothetical protein
MFPLAQQIFYLPKIKPETINTLELPHYLGGE